MSSKNIEKHLVGQPVFKHIIDLIPHNKFDLLVSSHKSDRYYKTFDSWTLHNPRLQRGFPRPAFITLQNQPHQRRRGFKPRRR